MENLQTIKKDKVNLLKYIIAGAIGFGIGWVCWYGIYLNYINVSISYTLYKIIAGLVFGAMGGILLSMISKDIKKNILKFVLFGSIGFAIIGLISTIFLGISQLIVIFMGWFLEGSAFSNFLSENVIGLVIISICFVIHGAIAGSFYGLALGKKIHQLAIAGAVGYGLGNIISIIFFGDVNYLMHYVTIGLITGISLGAGMYFAEKS